MTYVRYWSTMGLLVGHIYIHSYNTWENGGNSKTRISRRLVRFIFHLEGHLCDFFSQVSKDEVLHDSTGLHLGGGPYMLIYSRETEDTDFRFWWPTFFKVCEI